MKNNRNSFIGDQRLIHRQDYSRDPLVSPLKMKTLFRKNGTVLLLNSLMKTAGFQRLIHRQDYSRDPLVSPLKMKTLFHKNGTVLLLNSLMKTAGFQRSFNNKTLHFRGNAGFSL